MQVALRSTRVGVGRRAGQLGLLLAAFDGIREQVVGEACGHQPGAGQRQRDAGRVDGDPPPAPLLRDVGRRAAAARRVEHQVAGVGGHQQAALDGFGICLDDIDLLRGEPGDARIRPNAVQRIRGEVIQEANVPRIVSDNLKSSRHQQTADPFAVSFPFPLLGQILLALHFD